MAAQDDLLQQDVNFVRPYINDNTNFTGQQKTTLAEILNRAAGMNGRRGGLTKQMLLDLAPLLPGENTLRNADSKAVIIAGLLQMVALLPDTPDPPASVGDGDAEQVLGDAEQQDQQQVSPVLAHEGIPAGWEQYIHVDPSAADSEPKTLLKLKRGLLRVSHHKLLQLLLIEQEEVKLAQRNADSQLLSYARENLQEMAGNPAPLPRDTAPRLVWTIYLRLLQLKIDEVANKLDDEVTDSRTSRRNSSQPSAIQSDDSDSDLDSYAPNKRFALSRYKRKRKRKRKKKAGSSIAFIVRFLFVIFVRRG